MKKTKYIVVRHGTKTTKVDLPEMAAKFLDYAILSSNVYCASQDDKDFIPIDDWKLFEEPLPKIPPSKLKSQLTIYGLKYQVWWKEINQKINIVIVFKGTTFSLRNDWICNFRWLTMNPILKNIFKFFLWDYYHQVQVLTPTIVSNIKNHFQNNLVEFSVTVHSLGGGLAQQASYSIDAIKNVIVFDTSPVTGYFDIKKEFRLKNQIGIETCRVYQQGEILSYFRNFIRVLILPLSELNPSIKEYEFSFLKGSSIKRHKMRDFAIRLRKVVHG